MHNGLSASSLTKLESIEIATPAHFHRSATSPDRILPTFREIEQTSTVDVGTLERARSGDEKELQTAGYESDPELRRIIERHAVQAAIVYYKSRKYQVQEQGRPYDLLCLSDAPPAVRGS